MISTKRCAFELHSIPENSKFRTNRHALEKMKFSSSLKHANLLCIVDLGWKFILGVDEKFERSEIKPDFLAFASTFFYINFIFTGYLYGIPNTIASLTFGLTPFTYGASLKCFRWKQRNPKNRIKIKKLFSLMMYRLWKLTHTKSSYITRQWITFAWLKSW